MDHEFVNSVFDSTLSSLYLCLHHRLLELHYPEKISYDALRTAVIEAWNTIGEDLLKELIESMPARCAAMIAANGMHTPY
jgi:hypothetical protein